MDAVTRLRHGRSQTKQTVGLWIGLVTVHTLHVVGDIETRMCPVWRRGPSCAVLRRTAARTRMVRAVRPKAIHGVIGFSGSVAALPLAATAASGQTREYAHDRAVADAYLLEWDLRGRERHHFRERVKEEGPNFWTLTTSRATISERVRCVS